MFAKKVKEYKSLKRDSEIFLNKSKVCLSGLRKNFRKEFNKNLKRRINKGIEIKFSEFIFGDKKNNQDPAEIKIIFINGARALDNRWIDDYGSDAGRAVPFSVEWLEDFCREQTEILGIKIEIQKKDF